jgi:aminoglycoside phosphotransferase (APT) family kinase protein
MPSFKVIPPEDVAKARVLYETTSVSVHDIAKMLGIGTTTFMKRVKLWQWVRRNRRLAELDAAAKANVPVEKIRKLAARPKAALDRAALIARIRGAVLREVAAIEQSLATAESMQLRSPDRERAARALASLLKTLRETDTLEQALGAKEAEQEQEEGQFRDLDEFRRELVARLDRMRDAGSAD